MGCRAITPALVGLASRLEGKPFHLIASFCQRGKREDAVAYIRGKGLAADTPNLTVTYQGRHPQVKGNGYVPYYMVFDHTGRMVHHHMCGNYHGGDGLAMIEWVDRLLEKTPALWLGAQPFETHAALAERVAGGNALAKWVAEAESLQAAEPHAELDRILAGVTRYRDRGLQRAESLLAASPKDVLPLLEELADELGETETCKPVRERLASLEAGDVLDRSIAIAKQLGQAAAAPGEGEALQVVQTVRRGGPRRRLRNLRRTEPAHACVDAEEARGPARGERGAADPCAPSRACSPRRASRLGTALQSSERAQRKPINSSGSDVSTGSGHAAGAATPLEWLRAEPPYTRRSSTCSPSDAASGGTPTAARSSGTPDVHSAALPARWNAP